MKTILNNLIDTESLAKKLAKKLKPGQVVAFYGDLGSGKTTLVQFIAKELGVNTPVTSPTFVIQKNYKLKDYQIVHIDCYRFGDETQASELGFEELFTDPKNLVFVEWAEKIEKILPENTIRITMTAVDENKRTVNIIPDF